MRTMERNGVRLGVVNLTLEMAALEILRKYAETPRGHGALVNRLLYEFEARQAERERILADMQAVVSNS